MGTGRIQGRMYTLCGTLLLAGILYLNINSHNTISISIPIPWLQPKMGFVCTNVTHFFINADDGDCNKSSSASSLYLNGWNSYWLLGASATGKKDKVSKMLRKGREMGMMVCRTWAFSDGGPNALQISPGRFNEKVFQDLDYVIYEARRNGVRLILSLVNNLSALGGKPMYVKWANVSGVNVSDSGSDPFFRDPTIKRYYRDYVKAIITRRNRYSGVKYSDEPAIFAWELINEPRCDSNTSAPFLQTWIVEMSSFVKSLDKKHLVTVGLEGFYGPKTPKSLMANPGDWAASVGSDFIQNSATQDIDFASVHAYPDSWIPNARLEKKAKYLKKWVDFHISDSEQALKKPVLFTEIGSTHDSSNLLIKTIYDKIYESAQKEQAGAGAFIWQLMVEGMQEYRDEFSLVVNDRDNTNAFKLMIQQSCRLQYMFRKGKANTSSSVLGC